MTVKSYKTQAEPRCDCIQVPPGLFASSICRCLAAADGQAQAKPGFILQKGVEQFKRDGRDSGAHAERESDSYSEVALAKSARHRVERRAAVLEQTSLLVRVGFSPLTVDVVASERPAVSTPVPQGPPLLRSVVAGEQVAQLLHQAPGKG